MKIQLKYIEVKPSKMLLFSLSETAHGRSLLLTQLYRLPNFRKQLVVDPIIILGEEKDVPLTDN